MASSRAILVLGMHRSGTSLLTRGLRTLGICLGDVSLDTKPENPTGYWENHNIDDLNERLLAAFGLTWKSIPLIHDDQWKTPEVQALSTEAEACLQAQFLQHPLWGFKDPRTLRLLPFWRAVFQRLEIDDQYVVAIRNPLGVVASLLQHRSMAPATSYLLWLVYVVPYLHQIATKSFVVNDYDLLVADPRGQLARIGRALKIPPRETDTAEIEHFARYFLNPTLRHTYFSHRDLDTDPAVHPLVREAYLLLYQLATDQLAPDAPEFWTQWQRLRQAVEVLIADIPSTDQH